MTHTAQADGLRALRLIIIVIAALGASASSLMAAKAGSGQQNQGASGSFVQAVVDGQTFTHTLGSGQLAQSARNALAALVDAHASFIADPNTTLPPGWFDPNDVLFQVLTSASGEVTSLYACENDQNYSNSGVHFASGRPEAKILKPTAVAGGGNFNLRFDMLTGSDVNENFATSAGDVTGLNNAIKSTLTSLGFSVGDTGTHILATKPGNSIISARVAATDTQITFSCVGLEPVTPMAVPTMNLYGVLLLAVALLLSVLLLMQRRRAA